MMTLRVMRLITDRLDKGRNPIADQLVALWGAEQARFFRASANFIFRVQKDEKPYILRFNHGSERTHSGLQAEMDFLSLLAEQGVSMARPIRSLDGHFVETLQTPDGSFHAVMFEALPGEHPDFETLTPDQFKQWGQMLGHLHNASEGYRDGVRPTWQDHLLTIEAALPADETAAHTTLARLKSELSALPITIENFGLIHFDFELDNLLWHEGRISVIDFDDCAFYWFAADIAFALRDLFDDDPAQIDLTHPSAAAFVAGYRSHRALSDDDLRHLPLFLRLHNLLLFTRIMRSLGLDAPPDDPEWMIKLRARFKEILDGYRAGFDQ